MEQDILEKVMAKVIDKRIFKRYIKFIAIFGSPKKQKNYEHHHIKRKNTEAYLIAAKNKPSKICPHCNRTIKINVFEKFHNNNCKERK